MFRNLGKIVCGTCPPNEYLIKSREKRIEGRRLRISEKLTTTKDEDGKNASGSSEHSDEEYFDPSDGSGSESEGSQVNVDLDSFFQDKDEEDEDEPFKQNFNKQKEQSQENIGQILYDGDIWVTNVKVAAEYREIRRRDRLKAEKKARSETLRQEAIEIDQMYKDLQDNWNIKAEKILPLDLYGKIQEQQKASDKVLEKKQNQIEDLQNLMDENDWEFEEYLGYYQKDIMLMGDRIDDHMDKLFRSFLEELTLCEEFVQTEQNDMLRQYQQEWEDMMNRYETAERESLQERQNQSLNRFANMSEKHQAVKEDMRSFRRKLEDDYRNLVLLFENYKFASLLNSEKLDYNLEVIRRRELENITMRSSLKRAVLKFRDRYNTLRDEMRALVTGAKKETAHIIKEAQRFQEMNSSAARALLHMVVIDYRKFMEMWVVSEEEAKRKVELLLDIEEFIFQRMLGIKVTKMDLSSILDHPREIHCFMYNLEYNQEMLKEEKGDPTAWLPQSPNSGESPGTGGTTGLSNASIAGSKFVSSTGSANRQKKGVKNTPSLLLEWTPSLDFLPGPDSEPIFQRKLMTHIAQVISDETGFLLEEKLRKMLAPMIQQERTLVEFDAVLQALGIRTIPEMQLLCRYMLRNCTVMKGVMAKMDDVESPILQSMGVSLDDMMGDSSNLTLAETQTLETLKLKMIDQIYSDYEEEEVGSGTFVKGITIPKILYCEEPEEYEGEHDDGSGKTEGSGSDLTPSGESVNKSSSNCSMGNGETPLEGSADSAKHKSHSTGSMDTPEGCHRKTLSFNTAESMVMTWYKKDDSGVCHCEEPDGVCICDGEKDEILELVHSQQRTSSNEESSDTATVHSDPPTSINSQEFLFIPPNDVLRALAGFLKEFNAKTKLEKPTEEEVVDERLAKLRFPSSEEMRDYWNRFIPLVQNFGHDGFWESLLFCFQKYHTILKERNKYVGEVEQIRRQNQELAQLLKTHMEKNPQASLDINRATAPFC